MEKNMYEDYLEHHGVEGMKWGVRRYQNPDGTLTAAGRKHKRSISESYLNGFDKADKRLDQRIKNNQYEKKRAQKLTRTISDGSRLKNAYLNSFDSSDKRLRERKANNQYEKKRAEKLVSVLNKVKFKKIDEQHKKNGKSFSDKYIDAFDKKAANYQDRADRKRAEGKQSKQIFEKAAQRRESHVKTALEDKARAERLTRNISDNNKLKKIYLKGFDNKAAMYQDRAYRKRVEGEQSEKIFDKAAQRREAHVKTTLEDKERAKKLLKKK